MVTQHKKILERKEMIVIDSSDSEVDNRVENPNNNKLDFEKEVIILDFEKEVIVLDSSSDIEDKEKNKDVESEIRSDRKMKELEMLSDLTSFPGLAAMLAAEASMRERIRIRNQLRRMRKKLSKADDSEKEKTINNGVPAGQTVSESPRDGLLPCIEPEPCVSSLDVEKVNGDNRWFIIEMDSAATEVSLGEEKSKEQEGVVAATHLTLSPGLATTHPADASMRGKNKRNKLKRMRKKLSKADDSEKEKIITNGEPAEKTVSESPRDGILPCTESELCVSSLDGEKVNGDNHWCMNEMDSAATEVSLGLEKSKEQDDVVAATDLSLSPGLATMHAAEPSMMRKNRRRNQCEKMKMKLSEADGLEKEKIINNGQPAEETVSESPRDGLLPCVESEPCVSSLDGEKGNGDNFRCITEIDSAATKVSLGVEKSKEQDDVVAAADLTLFPGLATTGAAEASMPGKHRRKNQRRKMKKKHLKVANGSEKEKVLNNFKPAEKVVSESPGDGVQSPVESEPRPPSSGGEKVNGGDTEMHSVAAEVLGEERSKEQDDVVNDFGKAKTGDCQPAERTISETSCDGQQGPVVGEKVNGDDFWCREEMESAKTQLFLGEGKSNEEQDGLVCEKGEEKLVDSSGETNKRILVETESMDGKQNLVLQKLLRPPRYFSPPEIRSMCLEGNDGAAPWHKRKRSGPCFICADPAHEWRQCRKRIRHLNKDWQMKDVAEDCMSTSCLRCGVAGHDMFSCNNAYCSDDLKKIQCYVCKGFGHLCCVDYAAECPTQASCWRCGKKGHHGSECMEIWPRANSAKLATSEHEERSCVTQHLQDVMATTKPNPSTLETNAEPGDEITRATSAEQVDGTPSVRSTTHESSGTGVWERIAPRRSGDATWEWPRPSRTALRERIAPRRSGDATWGRPRPMPWPRQNEQRRWGWPRTRHDAQRQTVNMPRRNYVWVRPQTQPDM